MERIAAAIPHWLWSAGAITLAIGAALAVHWMMFTLARRAAGRTRTTIDDILVHRLRSPMRWLLVVFALSAVQPGLPLSAGMLEAWARVAGLLVPALLGWMAVALLGVVVHFVKARADITVADNLHARRRQTRANILHRIGAFVILLVTFCMMLMTPRLTR